MNGSVVGMLNDLMVHHMLGPIKLLRCQLTTTVFRCLHGVKDAVQQIGRRVKANASANDITASHSVILHGF